MQEGVWIKSRKSTANSQCVEVYFNGTDYYVRNSRDPNGPQLTFTADEWDAFKDGINNREF